MDTRIQLYQLIGYSDIYENSPDINYAKKLLSGISSECLINYISRFNIYLYLNDQRNDIQRVLLMDLLQKMTDKDRDNICKRIKIAIQKSQCSLIFFWNYSNTLFYNVIFQTYNNTTSNDLTASEAKCFFDAYLIINQIAAEETDGKIKEYKVALQRVGFEDMTVAAFIQQRDYMSNLDFRNQIIRGVKLFDYIENHPIYGMKISDYYASIGINDYRDIVTTIGEILCYTQCTNNTKRFQIFVPMRYSNRQYLDSLCINNEIGQHESYLKVLKNKCLYKISDQKYFVLDINNVINQLYKSQIFRLNDFLGDPEFLNNKAKDLTERVLLDDVMKKAFSLYDKLSNDCKNSKKEELCDYYIRQGNKICIIELKDVMVNDEAKISKQIDEIFLALDLKLVKNQKGSPKGINQLSNAITDIDSHGISFDNIDDINDVNIYPIIIYTDNAMGADGLNYHYQKVFSKNLCTSKIKVHDVVFINLSYFEMHLEYFAQKKLNLFSFIDEYHKHIQNDQSKMTPFEVFSRVYFQNHNMPILAAPKDFNELIDSLINQQSPTQHL